MTAGPVVTRKHVKRGKEARTTSTLMGATDLSVQCDDLSGWPTGGANGKVPVTLDRGSSAEEHALASSIDTATGIITFATLADRGVDNTTAQQHSAGAVVSSSFHGTMADDTDAFLSLPAAKGDLCTAYGADQWGSTTVGADNAVLVASSAADGGVAWSATLSGLTLTAPTINNGTLSLGSGTLILPQAASPAQTAEGSIVWDTDDDVATVGDGSSRRTLLDTAKLKAVRKAAAETVNNSATLQNDDALLFAVAANENWAFEIVFFFDGDATADIKYDVTAPAGATLTYALVTQWSTTDVLVPSSTGAQSLGTDALNSRMAVVRGTCFNGANAGNVQFRWAQDSAVVADTVVRDGSYLTARKF